MDLDTDDELLRALAEGETMHYELWPDMLTRLLPRLAKIIEEDFASPSKRTTSNPPSSPPSESSQDKENAPPPEPALPSPSPSPIQDLVTSITKTLTTHFTKNPPHTIQRLAELILEPTQHYRSLPAYLHALDRVVHVTSGAQTFPLPPAIPDPSSLSLLSNGTSTVDSLSVSWGNPAASVASAFGSDESLGGALLTPISWLNRPSNGTGSSTGSHSPFEGEVKTESTGVIEGPNGPGGIETVSVSVNGISSATAQSSDSEIASLRAEGGITQGELLRQEQRAGVVPVTQLVGRGDSDGLGEEDEMPHARGPEEIGVEDMGPQNSAGNGAERISGLGMLGIDIEAAVGRKLDVKKYEGDDEGEKAEEEKAESKEEPSTPKRDAETEMGGEDKRVRADEVATGEEVEVVDADGKTASL